MRATTNPNTSSYQKLERSPRGSLAKLVDFQIIGHIATSLRAADGNKKSARYARRFSTQLSDAQCPSRQPSWPRLLG
jgi:hypothetical protein